MNASMILKGDRFNRASITVDEAIKSEVESNAELRLLGRTESYVFFWMPDRSRVLMIEGSDLKSMQMEAAGKYAARKHSADPTKHVDPSKDSTTEKH